MTLWCLALGLALTGTGPMVAPLVPDAGLRLADDGARPLAPPPDRWLAEDKLQHFTMSFAATTMAYGAARFGADRDTALATAAAAALGLGLAKELLDQRRGGRFSLKDLAWDVAGVALGVVFTRRIR
ncbi:MAG: hypothetical protein ACLFRX_11975 [Gemmatimonadota bacterium]